jgi:hypothetical protein
MAGIGPMGARITADTQKKLPLPLREGRSPPPAYPDGYGDRRGRHAASWKMMPSVCRRPACTRLTPWRMVAR